MSIFVMFTVLAGVFGCNWGALSRSFARRLEVPAATLDVVIVGAARLVAVWIKRATKAGRSVKYMCF
jgi:hypothetical protein